MKGSETKLIAYMQGSDKRFIIPVYQRNYDWKTENCKQLYDDLVKVIRQQRKSHFFGSIVSVNNDGEFNQYLVIDGQQRLTTISLLLLAMYNLMKEGVLVPHQGNLADKIYKTYLIDEWQDDDTRIKLKPVKNDQKAFQKLFDDKSNYIPDSNLTLNYNYFYNRIQKEEITLDELYDAITRLEIINIRLNQDDNPQLIFESLNSTGVALSEGDKIRNFILMGLPIDQQKDFYEKYWNPIEICTDYDVSMFVRDYLSVKQQMIPAMNKIYFTFKAFVEDTASDTEPLLQDLLRYAQWYKILLKGTTSNRELNACIHRLNQLETTITRPFFLEVLRLQSEGQLSLTDVKDIFLYTENYLFRRTICDLPTNSLNKIFSTLHREIIRYDGTDDNYLEKFKYALLSKLDRVRFPDDEEFVDAFSTRSIYPMKSKNKVYILERFENGGTVEGQDVYKKCDEGIYSIEHIMPQHLTPAWVKELGDEYETIHDTWLHRLANLTLTGYNSKYSNSSFLDKRDMDNGFAKSHLFINNWIAQQSHWRLDELEARNQLLMQQALALWPMPTTTFKPTVKQMDTCSLDDDVDLSGREIVRFAFKNTEQPVTSWIDMMEQVLKMLHAEDPSVLSRFAHSSSDDSDLSAFVSHRPQDLRTALEIDHDVFIEKNTNTTQKLSMLRRLFKAYRVEEDTLTFYLKDKNDDKTKDESARYDRRRRYWTFAAPIIKKAYEDTEHHCFAGCTTTKCNWITGSFGMSGFYLTCVSNRDQARVELVLTKANKDTNKEAFDFLLAHKTEIEQALGTAVEWLRLDEKKSSYIMLRLYGVSIENETDWTQMAKFQAEWSRKFYDVFVPYLKQNY